MGSMSSKIAGLPPAEDDSIIDSIGMLMVPIGMSPLKGDVCFAKISSTSCEGERKILEKC